MNFRGLVLAVVIGAGLFVAKPAAAQCVIGFDDSYALSQIPSYALPQVGKWASNSFAVQSPGYKGQDCGTTGQVRAWPLVYTHFHLDYTDPVGCFGTGDTSGWFGKIVNGACQVYNPLQELRTLTPHNSDEDIRISTSTDNFATIHPFHIGTFVLTSMPSTQIARICLHVVNGGWNCYTANHAGLWIISGSDNFQQDQIALQLVNNNGAVVTWDNIQIKQ